MENISAAWLGRQVCFVGEDDNCYWVRAPVPPGFVLSLRATTGMFESFVTLGIACSNM